MPTKGKTALPGFFNTIHAAWMFRNGTKQENGSGNSLVCAYLNTLGLTDEAIVFITSTAPDEVAFLSSQKAEIHGRSH